MISHQLKSCLAACMFAFKAIKVAQADTAKITLKYNNGWADSGTFDVSNKMRFDHYHVGKKSNMPLVRLTFEFNKRKDVQQTAKAKQLRLTELKQLLITFTDRDASQDIYDYLEENGLTSIIKENDDGETFIENEDDEKLTGPTQKSIHLRGRRFRIKHTDNGIEIAFQTIRFGHTEDQLPFHNPDNAAAKQSPKAAPSAGQTTATKNASPKSRRGSMHTVTGSGRQVSSSAASNAVAQTKQGSAKRKTFSMSEILQSGQVILDDIRKKGIKMTAKELEVAYKGLFKLAGDLRQCHLRKQTGLKIYD